MIRMLAAAVMALVVSLSAQAQALVEKIVENEHIGKVRFLTPEDWKLGVRHHINFGTTFLNSPNQKAEEFEISFNDAKHLQFRWKTEAELREFVDWQMQQYVGRSVEKKVTLRTRDGENKVVYATLTDAQPKPGEFKLVTLGVARNGEAVYLIYQLTNDPKYVERIVKTVADAHVIGK